MTNLVCLRQDRRTFCLWRWLIEVGLCGVRMVYNRISDSKNALNIVEKYRKLIPRGVTSDNFEVDNVQNAPLDLQNELLRVEKEVFTLQIRF